MNPALSAVPSGAAPEADLTFSLADDPWLSFPSLADGQVVAHSVRDALRHAHELGDLSVALPTQRPAVFRQLLLPLVVDALGRPADERVWVSWFRAGRWSPEQLQRLDDYLDRHGELFDLFHPRQPFAQVADLRTAKGETKGAGLIVATASTGNNVPLFASRTEAEVLALTPAQAAHWLLHTHGWDTAAIKTGAVGDEKVKAGKTTGNPIGPLGQLGVTFPIGSTLFETLLLNIPSGPPPRSTDRPQWLRRAGDGQPEAHRSVGTARWSERVPEGLLDLWTWQSRRIRLFPIRTPEGPRVTRVLVAAGDRMPHTPDIETHTMWRIDPTASKPSARRKPIPASRPLRLRPGKAAWRGLDALLAPERADRAAREESGGFATSRVLDHVRAVREEIGETYPLRVELTGIAYGNQSAVVEDVMSDSLPLPLAALGEQTHVHGAVLEIAEQAEQLATAVNILSADLHRSLGAEPIPWDKGQRPGELVLHALDPLVRRFLAGVRRTPDTDEATIEAGQLAWEQLAWRHSGDVADRLLRAVPVAAYAGRSITQQDGKTPHSYRASLAEASFRKRRSATLRRAEAHWRAGRPRPSADGR
ncbi:type I-E CRISPR-associated protein Cse1/CasA [Streptomyces sp. NPDC057638]|uniref:type I-E CRISPR-associated protein Cse1/CasA n=1 Tax=Streptomyces sp. NPDC057638 TaxID=3346190 RepID=UPI0036B8C38D